MTGRTAPLPRRTVTTAVGLVTAACLVGLTVTDGAWRDAVSSSAVLLPAVAIAVGLARGTLGRRWWVLLGGLLVLALHNLVWMVEAHTLALEPPASPVTAAALPLGYAVLGLGGALVVREPLRRGGGPVLDAAIIGLAASLPVWVLLLAPRLDPMVSDVARARAMVSLVVLSATGGAILRAATILRERRPALLLMLATLLATVIGTMARDLTVVPDEPLGASWVAAVWVLAYGAGAAAALDPTASTPVERTPPSGRLTGPVLVALGIALTTPPALLAVRHLTAGPDDPVLLVAANLVLVPLVVLRLAHLARWHADAEEQLAHLATHDELTGLPNRRAIDRRVHEALDRVAHHRSPGAVVAFCDLDDFKEVNDRLGHHAGDARMYESKGARRRGVGSPALGAP